MEKESEQIYPSQVSSKTSWFDNLAKKMAEFASKSWFFIGCVLLILIWAPSYFIVGSIDTWQLIINTATTIITFLMVAIIQNTQSRDNSALQHKLNAIARGLADFMEVQSDRLSEEYPELADQLAKDVCELNAAVGVEQRESS